MTLDTIHTLPGGKDINDQFLGGTNIHKSLAILKRMTGHGGHYRFGTLTADFYNLRGQERQHWLDECDTYPVDARDKIKAAIVAALSNTAPNGDPAPIQIMLKWTQNGGAPDVKVYETATLHTIEILNLVPPMASALAERRDRKK